MPAHINLTVSDVDHSARFHQHWLGFGPEDRRFADGTVFLRDSEGTDLALHAGHVPIEPSSLFHFGFRRRSRAEVLQLHHGLSESAVEVVDLEEGPGMMSVKLMDPDGYVVEVYWES